MNNKRLISLTACLVLATVPGISSLILADIASETDTKAQQHFEKANELRKLADYDGAITEYKKVISQSANSKIAQDAQYWIGQTYFEAGQFDAALTAFQKLLDEYPDSKIVPSTKLMMERIQEAKKVKSLHEAATKGDIGGVKWLISKGADVNARDQKSVTPLFYAVKNARKKVAELLIVKGADVNAREDRWGMTPLFLVGDHRDLAELLIANGADVNLKAFDGDSALYAAARRGARDVVEFLFAKGADTSAQGWATTAHQAASWGQKDVLELLIDIGSHVSSFSRAAFIGDLPRMKKSTTEGTDINTRDVCGWTPLVWAILGGQPDVAAFLINRGADVNATDKKDTMPLHYAAVYGYMEVAQLLIAKGADVNAKGGEYDVTPLLVAAKYGHTAVVELLIAEGADVNARQRTGHTSLQHAAGRGHLDVVELLISRGANIEAGDNWGSTPLGTAVSYNSPEAVKLLLKRGAYIDGRDHYDNTPLHRAITKGNQDMVELLLANGAAPWRRRIGLGLVGIAMEAHKKEMVRFLIDKGIEHSAVHVAAFLGDLDEVKSYLAAGGDINAQDISRLTLLACAIAGGQAAEAEFLVSKGADINLKGGFSGMPALHWAMWTGRSEIAIMLLDKGADITIRDDFGCTALYWAALAGRYYWAAWAPLAGHKDIVEKILTKRADVNAKSGVFVAPGAGGISDEGWTPLHGASVRGRKAVAEVLIANGADVNAETKNGKTPMSLAKGKGYELVVELLRKHGAKE